MTAAADTLLSGVFDNAPIGMALLAPDGSWLRVNPALCEMAGYSTAELLKLDYRDVCPDDLDADLIQIRRMLAGEIRRYQLEKRYSHQNGQLIWVRLSVSLVRDETGAPQHFIAQVEDITDRKQAEYELRRAHDYSEAIVAAMGEGYSLTVDGRLTAVNDALCRLTGFSRAALEGASAPFPFWPNDAIAETTALRDRIVTGGGGTFEIVLMRADGTRFDAEITARPARNPDGTMLGFVNTLRDVSERNRYEAELERLASHDPLTGLANHRVFHERLHAETARANRHGHALSVAIMDLDNFKAINDNHGHLVGDQVLRAASERLAGLTREGELIARVGGEEFAWILPDAYAGGAFAAAERARRVIGSTPIAPIGHLTLSAGVCDLTYADEPAELYRLADEALYWAKRTGRNRTTRYGVQIARVAR